MAKKFVLKILQALGSHFRKNNAAYFWGFMSFIAALIVWAVTSMKNALDGRFLPTTLLAFPLGFFARNEVQSWRAIRNTHVEWSNAPGTKIYASDYGTIVRDPLCKEWKIQLMWSLREPEVTYTYFPDAQSRANELIRSHLWALHRRKRLGEFSLAFSVALAIGVAYALFVVE